MVVALPPKPLDERSAVEVVRSWRVTDADGAARALLGIRSGLPLALRAAGEGLVEKRPQLSLNDAVLVFGTGGQPHSEDRTPSVSAVLALACQGLSDPARQLCRLLGCLPGTTGHRTSRGGGRGASRAVVASR
ncbi:hypothetical protein ACYF6T_16680 [Streptomyces sp. 7R007]